MSALPSPSPELSLLSMPPLESLQAMAPAVSPPCLSLRNASLLAEGTASHRRRKLWCCVSSTWQQPKHGCVILTNSKHSTRWAAANKINSNPARPTTSKRWTAWKSSFPAVPGIFLGCFGNIAPMVHTCSSPLQMVSSYLRQDVILSYFIIIVSYIIRCHLI